MTMPSDLPLDVVETMNREAMDASAPIIDSIIGEVREPVEDIELFIQHIPGRRMLDLGCGWIPYIHRFVDSGLEYVGIDLSLEMVKLARGKQPTLRFEQMSFRALNFPQDSFYGVWCCCALEYEPKRNVGNVLDQICKVLCADGIFVLVMPDLGSSSEFVGPLHQRIPKDAFCSLWHLEEFEKELRRAGFEVLQSTHRLSYRTMSFLARAK